MIYLIGSMKNPRIPEIAKTLRHLGHDVFDDWYSPGPEADDYWQKYERHRGRTFAQALESAHAWNVFRFDKLHLDRADKGVLVMPAGRSGHIELGYIIGTGKAAYILMEGEPDRYDVMYRFATGVFTNLEDLCVALGQ